MGSTEESDLALPQYSVDVVEPGTPARCGLVSCEIGKNLKFNTIGLQNYCLANWDARVYDLFVVAAAVEFCDRTKKRHSTRWGRDFELRVPVHDPSHWKFTSTALCSALYILTGDRWQFEFTTRRTKAPTPPQGHLPMPEVNPCAIVPYSDGLDSFAVAGLMKHEYGNDVLRVRLGLKSLNEGRTRDRPLPFASVPYRVSCESKRADETSARSRGFKFAVLSGVAAYLSGAQKVVVPDSGQGALGSSLTPVGQAYYEDYRSHPFFTDRMTAFLSALLDYEVRFTYPRLWYTKAETLNEFVAKCPDNQNWTQTRSCWQNQRRVSVFGRKRQCGVCAACMLRRMSIHAAGLRDCRESYVWEDLTATRYEHGAAALYTGCKEPKGAMYEYAVAGSLYLGHLANALQSHLHQASVSRQVFKLSRSLGLPDEEVRTKVHRLIEQHRKEWRNFLRSLGPESFVTRWIKGGEGHG